MAWKYQAYPEYRDSKIEWADRVPAHWQSKNIGYVASLKSGDAITAEEIEAEGSYPVFGGNGLRGYCEKYNHKGEYVLIGRQGALCGNINYADGYFWASEHALVVYPFVDLDLKWFGETLRSMDLNQYSVSAAQPGLSVSNLTCLKLPFPPIAEQQKIASFLAHETAKIDTLIEKQQQLIKLLKEKRQAVISHAVTKGLNPNVPMKDSGAEWLGEVPAHWQVAKLAHHYEVLLGKMLDDKKITGEHLGNYLRNTDVQWDRVNVEDLPQMDFRPEEQERYSVKKGDLLVCEGGEIGRCAIWQHDETCFYQKALHRLRPYDESRNHPRFMFYVLFDAVHRERFVAGAGKATIAHLPAETFRQYRFTFPPFGEQRSVADYLDMQSMKYELLETKALAQIELLQERRTALISAAVTGKIDVRDWQPPASAEAASRD